MLVVDECAPDRHARISEQLPADPRISLITIDEGETRAGRTPSFLVKPMPGTAINELLSRNFPMIPHQQRQVIVPVANGHPRDAEAMARRMMDPGATDQATDLAAESSLTVPFVGNTLRVAEGVALFEELGWDGAVATEREQLEDFLGLETAEFRDAATELEQNGWMTARGPLPFDRATPGSCPARRRPVAGGRIPHHRGAPTRTELGHGALSVSSPR